jgi:hypothetical protein
MIIFIKKTAQTGQFFFGKNAGLFFGVSINIQFNYLVAKFL